MEDIVVCKAPGNILVPATEADAEKIAKFKVGTGVRLKATKMSEHNYRFHKKLFALFNFCFDNFSERVDVGVKYRGERVMPSLDTFREHLTILAGYYETPTYAIDGSVRLRAKSIAYSNMTDEEKERLFSAVIDAALRHVYRGTREEQWLRDTVERLIAFDGIFRT